MRRGSSWWVAAAGTWGGGGGGHPPTRTVDRLRPTHAAVVDVLVALVRLRRVREADVERTVVVVDAVAEQVVRRPVGVAAALAECLHDRSDNGSVAAREGAQLDVGDVVLEPPPVREAGEVAREDAEPVP